MEPECRGIRTAKDLAWIPVGLEMTLIKGPWCG